MYLLNLVHRLFTGIGGVCRVFSLVWYPIQRIRRRWWVCMSIHHRWLQRNRYGYARFPLQSVRFWPFLLLIHFSSSSSSSSSSLTEYHQLVWTSNAHPSLVPRVEDYPQFDQFWFTWPDLSSNAIWCTVNSNFEPFKFTEWIIKVNWYGLIN